MRILENFNQSWQYCAKKVELDDTTQEFDAVCLPHSNKYYNQRFVDNETYQFVSTYRKHFVITENLLNKQVFIDFDGVMLEATVYLNGTLLGVHQGGYSGFSYELTPYLLTGNNCLTVYVDSTERPDIPPYGNLVDYLTFGGIYRDVTLRIVNQRHIVASFPRPSDLLTEPKLACDVTLNTGGAEVRVEAILEDANGRTVASQQVMTTEPSVTLNFDQQLPVTLWSLQHPYLYTLRLALYHADAPMDMHSVRFGFREAEFRTDGKFYLNGEHVQLFGLNRHQTYPYIGIAAPQRLQAMDADILKYELSCNVVRTSHYPQSPHFLNRCDEIGLLVFEELAGWQHIGDVAWQQLVLQDLQAMIERDRHHPSIILWGVRVNESPDHTEFYGQTNALARRIDPTRQTGGVRNFITSEFLEDVFTLNDFPDGIQIPLVTPHLITEFAGHMYPTKPWDHEERRVEHALRHVEKHNLQMGHGAIAGAIGWCAFDYHTHKEFGSGDRICYHGVMDVFRLPKMAGHFYKSQKPPSKGVVLHIASHWTMGDRNGGGNNPLVIFSNCDEIEVLIGDQSQGRFHADALHYPHLKFPPFVVRWAEPYNPWGLAFSDLTVRGYVAGECVAEQRIASDHLPYRLQVTASSTSLKADGGDMARIAVQVLDRYGNVLPYQTRLAYFELEGNGQLIGENPLVLIGGQAAIFVQAQTTVGNLKITVRCADLPNEVINMDVHP